MKADLSKPVSAGPDSFTANLSQLDRWMEELSALSAKRETLWFGVVGKAAANFDVLLAEVLEHVRRRDPERFDRIAKRVLGPTLIERSTLGQKTDVLSSLDKNRVLTNRRMLTERDKAAFQKVVAQRNLHAHGKSFDLEVDRTRAFLEDLRRVTSKLKDVVARGGD